MAKGLDDHLKILNAISGDVVSIGWFEENKYPTAGGQTVAEVMERNEYGSKNTPARPLMRQTANIVNAKIEGFISRRIDDALEKKISPDQVSKLVGEVVIGVISDQFKFGGFAPNAPSTIKKKGFDKPLIDTANASQTVQYKVAKE